jgi:hypothetical protein
VRYTVNPDLANVSGPVSLPFIDVLTPVTFRLETNAPFTIYAATLVDTRTGDFQQLQPSPWQRVLSSDIELYENAAVMPRAFVVYDVHFVSDDDLGTEMALEAMRDPDFDPAATIYIAGEASVATTEEMRSFEASHDSPLQNAAFTEFTPTRVSVSVRADAPSFLMLTDAYYPGWTAAVNGTPTEVRRADVMFRAVPIPDGESEVVFEYRPVWLPSTFIIGGLGWLLAALAIASQKRIKFPNFR